ncbi:MULTISPECIES: hypothetical protein [Paenibacillus]|uniref:YqzM family protein n=1 Tax=Paenibacillus radicis (ex Xue et al. 2023) TaxID=2972489 RepID=A0ABT1YVC0_9BACL|nr:hypothetical protein [Paenibacillus radicis (ex Xue et al. 2023)]MCR8636895.1 hypothetical protein [Paenibacillus radicis (ex Xue et al. 2023)]
MDQLKNVEIEKKSVEQKYDKGMVASTFIKYAAYIIIFFGFLYFIVRYVFPAFQ